HASTVHRRGQSVQPNSDLPTASRPPPARRVRASMVAMMNAGPPPRLARVGYDAELRRHNELLRRACGIQSRDHVLDIGCGTGQTTRQAARTAAAGSALGIDVSAPAI